MKVRMMKPIEGKRPTMRFRFTKSEKERITNTATLDRELERELARKKREIIVNRFIVATLCIFCLGASPLFAYNPPNGSLGFSSDTGQKQITVFNSAVTSGTLILSNEPSTTGTQLVNQSSWTTVYIATFSAVTPTNGFPIQPNSKFTPDGPAVPWWGQMFAVVSGTGTLISGIDARLSVFKTR